MHYWVKYGLVSQKEKLCIIRGSGNLFLLFFFEFLLKKFAKKVQTKKNQWDRLKKKNLGWLGHKWVRQILLVDFSVWSGWRQEKTKMKFFKQPTKFQKAKKILLILLFNGSERESWEGWRQYPCLIIFWRNFLKPWKKMFRKNSQIKVRKNKFNRKIFSDRNLIISTKNFEKAILYFYPFPSLDQMTKW